MLLYIEVH